MVGRDAMTFNAPSFFVGVGTVLGILLVGFGGGVVMSNVFLDKGPREPNKIERQAAEIAKPRVVQATPTPTAPTPAPQVAEPAPPSPPPPAPQVQQATTQPEPQPAPQVQQAIVQPEPAPSPPPTVGRVPLGAEQPVALVNPAHDPTAEREARKKAQEAKRLEKKRKAESRKFAEQQRREQRLKEAEELRATTQRSRQSEVDDDDDDREERPPLFRPQRETPFGRPFFRMFGGDD